jgi:hypothetical protein
MSDEFLWENCFVRYDDKFWEFVRDYYGGGKRRCMILGGAGFDPRSAKFVGKMANILGDNLSVIMVKEERPFPSIELTRRADQNLELMKKSCKPIHVLSIPIFSSEQVVSVIGGRRLVEELQNLSYIGISDIFIDISALSIGISFPLVRFFYNLVKQTKEIINLHIVVNSNPELDQLIKSSPMDVASEVHGFSMQNLYGTVDKTYLWMPQLAPGRQNILSTIHAKLNPHDTCPILPFPSLDNLKLSDEIVCELINQIENEWNIDIKNFVYADERKPLDIYRTIIRISTEREPVFSGIMQAQIVLSPLGSKITAIGALMASLEKEMPIVYVEALSYDIDDWEKADRLSEQQSKLVHIWLYGEAYFRDVKKVGYEKNN